MVLVSIAGLIGTQFSNVPISFPNGSGVLIIDEIGSSNGSTIPSALGGIIRSLGMQAEYVSGITIDQLASLTSLDYRLIIIRAHAGRDSIGMEQQYSYWDHSLEQLNDEVGAIRLSSGAVAFAVTPKFVTTEMKGTFEHKPIIMIEGCATLEDTALAQAFIEKGAAAFVGWNTTVTLNYADTVTGMMLGKLIFQNETLGNSVLHTMREKGPDPSTGAVLSYYPPSASSILYGSESQ